MLGYLDLVYIKSENICICYDGIMVESISQFCMWMCLESSIYALRPCFQCLNIYLRRYSPGHPCRHSEKIFVCVSRRTSAILSGTTQLHQVFFDSCSSNFAVCLMNFPCSLLLIFSFHFVSADISRLLGL
jgi:hypothetical protein